MCIAVDAPGAILQMQLLCWSWSWRCSSALAIVAWSRKFCNVMGRSGIGVMPSIDDTLHSITFVLGSSFVVPFFDDEPLERLLAHVAFKLSIKCKRVVVSMARGWA
eukprot:8123572-Ditylum_brightwellii.AAC.1